MMAKRLRQASRARRLFIAAKQSVDVDSYITALVNVRSRAVAAGQSSHVDECLAVERRVRSGHEPQPTPWVRERISEHFAKRTKLSRVQSDTHQARKQDSGRRSKKGIVSTGWSTAFPALPPDIVLPQLSQGLQRLLEQSDVPLTTDTLNWIRLACLHPSYLYENSPDASITASTLALLEGLGRAWVRAAMLERLREIRGEYSSSADCSRAMTVNAPVIAEIGRWLQEENAIHLGRGELLAANTGKRSKAPSVVASQVAGACALVSASQAPIDQLLTHVPHDILSPRTNVQSVDWTTLLLNHNAGRDVEIEYGKTGPDHAAVFSARITVRGRAVDAKASSKKLARREASRLLLKKIAPAAFFAAENSLPPVKKPMPTGRPLPYSNPPPAHQRATEWLCQRFQVADLGLMTQALTHKSWVYENQTKTVSAMQRDNSVLATEGSEVLNALVFHSCALQLFGESLSPKDDVIAGIAANENLTAQLFNAMPVRAGVLASRGTELSNALKSDFAQSFAAASWRANGDLLAEQQPVELQKWLQSLSPELDTVTLTHRLFDLHGIEFWFERERSGPDHAPELRANFVMTDPIPLTIGGETQRNFITSKHLTAQRVLSLAVGDELISEEDHRLSAAIRSAFILADLNRIRRNEVDYQRAIREETLAVGYVLGGDVRGYTEWTAEVSDVAGSAPRQEIKISEARDILSRYYTQIVDHWRHQRLTALVKRLMPRRSENPALGHKFVEEWLEGNKPARLALLWELLVDSAAQETVRGLTQFLSDQVAVLASEAGAESNSLEVEAEHEKTLSFQVKGFDLPSMLEPVSEIVGSIYPGLHWTSDSDIYSVAIPVWPNDPQSITGAVGNSTSLENSST